MEEKLNITSNTLGRLVKAQHSMFSDVLTFVLEFIQNAQRARAKYLGIMIEGDTISFGDDGCGCKNPEALFTLDYSEWESTKEGFGMGFWSCLAIPDVSEIEIRTRNWKTVIDAQKLLGGDLSVVKESIPFSSGFFVSITSPYISEHKEEIYEKARECSKYITTLKTCVGGEMVETRDVLDDTPFPYNSLIYERFENSLFRAELHAVDSLGSVQVYYDSRPVKTLHCFSYIRGVIVIKKGKITLKEPDRQEFIYDRLYDRFYDKVRECGKELYKKYITLYGLDNESIVGGVQEYLKVSEYDKFLKFDIPELCDDVGDILATETPVEETIETAISDASFDKEEFTADDVSSVVATDPTPARSVIPAAPVVFAASVAEPEAAEIRPSSSSRNSFREGVKKTKNLVFVPANEVDEYKNAIAEAQYAGLRVFVAPNRLYSEALTLRRVPHVRELKDCLTKTFVKKNIALKNGKEETFIQLLAPVCKKYGLPLSVFRIANLELLIEFAVDGKVRYKHKISNTAGKIGVMGETDGHHIYLDRRMLRLKDFNIRRGKWTTAEIKAVMNSLETVSHELAHYLHQTTDNTVEHFNTQLSIHRDLISLYL